MNEAPSQHKVVATVEADTLGEAMARALDLVEDECLVNASVGMLPVNHCPCPDHNTDPCGYQVQVSGTRWDYSRVTVDQ